MSDKKIHWWEDSSGRKTCHRNEPGLNAAESYVGEVRGNNLDGWSYKLRDGEWSDTFETIIEAKQRLMDSLGVVELTIWD